MAKLATKKAKGTPPATGTRPATPTAPPPVEQDLKLADLDLSPAEAVRDRTTDAARRRIAEAVERYTEADRLNPGCLSPVAAFRGKTATFVGDGSCRVAAATANARETVRGHVRGFPTDAAALAAARRCAWAANGTHGLPRTNDDKRQVVRAWLLSSQADTSDFRIKTVTRFSNELIRNVREAMTREGRFPAGDPRRADTPGRYDPNAKRRGGVRPADAGDTTAPRPSPASVKPPSKAPAAGVRNAGQNDSRNDAGGDGVEGPHLAEPVPVPERLLGLFRERGRIGRAVVALAELSATGAGELQLIPGFAAMAEKADRLAGELNQIKPDAVCDRCEGSGAEADDPCPGCKGLGWIVRMTEGHYDDPIRLPAAA